MQGFKTPSRFMAGFITVLVLLDFSAILLSPLYAPGVEFDDSLKQILFAIVMLAVGFYLGSSKASEDKNETIRQQAAAVVAVAGTGPGLPPPGAALNGGPDGTPEHPVAVVDVEKPPAGFAPTQPAPPPRGSTMRMQFGSTQRRP